MGRFRNRSIGCDRGGRGGGGGRQGRPRNQVQVEEVRDEGLAQEEQESAGIIRLLRQEHQDRVGVRRRFAGAQRDDCPGPDQGSECRRQRRNSALQVRVPAPLHPAAQGIPEPPAPLRPGRRLEGKEALAEARPGAGRPGGARRTEEALRVGRAGRRTKDGMIFCFCEMLEMVLPYYLNLKCHCWQT